jgi:hypothetical protein
MQKPAVKVEVTTFAEAAQRQVALASGPPRLGRVERGRDQAPAYADLKSYFSHRGDVSRVEEEAGRFSSRMLNRSREALRHAWAIKRHLSDLSRPGFADGAAESRIRMMIREHARIVERETKALRMELQPIFFPQAPGADVKDDGGENVADKAAAIQRLLDTCSGNEKAIRMAFALSGGDPPLYVKSDQFWQSLRRSEALAAKLQEWL